MNIFSYRLSEMTRISVADLLGEEEEAETASDFKWLQR
jgi:hypothetical protein